MAERQEAEHKTRRHTLHEAAAAGIADIDAGEFRSFEALQPLLIT